MTITAFYVKCRPQEFDAAELAVSINRVFIGYPAWRKGGVWDKHNVGASLVDISAPDAVWETEELSVPDNFNRFVTMYRKFAQRVSPGSMVVIPRPGDGVCHIGRISGKFELVDNPAWADEYLDMRQKAGLPFDDEKSLIGNVVQTWPVEEFHKIAFPLVPSWIQYRLLSRNTLGWIEDRPDGKRNATDVLTELYDGKNQFPFPSTNSVDEIEGRLLDWTTPNSFEHLVCSLLQCESPEVRWIHTGGSGDGGADGIGINLDGAVVAILQCKWKFGGSPWTLGEALESRLRRTWGSTPHVYVASLDHSSRYKGTKGAVTFLDRRNIADLLLKHRSNCPFAITIGVS